MTDMIADLLTRMRNAGRAKHKYADVRMSKMNRAIVTVLQERGFVRSFIANDKKRLIRVFLKYYPGVREGAIRGLKRVSKPGMRRYVGVREIPVVLSGLGIAILSTHQGVVDGERARKINVGGELLCLAW
ncbi:MAG: 30S ribosomal protein S8 [Simkaniaceae bacterium]|nr:30S ribosomal protein S8 [Simkaniaceae bacterium]